MTTISPVLETPPVLTGTPEPLLPTSSTAAAESARAAEAIDHRALMKKVERTVDLIGRTDDLGATIRAMVETVVREFRDQLGIVGGRLYRHSGSSYVLKSTFGDAKSLKAGLRVPRSYPAIEACCNQGVVYMEADDPAVDPELEEQLGVKEFACIEVGDQEYVVAFNVNPGHNRDDILFSLSILRHSVNNKLRQERLQEVLREAHKIQVSILPRKMPHFPPFDIYGRSESLDSVGGDYYDWISVTDKILGLAVADVTGHGLPAALQVRDIYMGLRMGMERDFKIVRTVESLNRIIHGSSLTSRFVSMVYGEVELNGNFIYVNAGHPAPIHLRADGRVEHLREGGPVLGPLPDATYERGFAHLRPGDALVLFSDGILETQGWPEDGKVDSTLTLEDFGTERLQDLLQSLQLRGASAREMVDAVFDTIERFSVGRPATDDRTVLALTYPRTDADD